MAVVRQRALVRVLLAAPVALSTGPANASVAVPINQQCLESFGPTPFPRDFWYLKVEKTSSSTLAGVMRQLCAHHGVHCLVPPPDVYVVNASIVADLIALAKSAHGIRHFGLANHVTFDPEVVALLDRPLLFASVREPVARFHSHFHYHVCHTLGQPCDSEQRRREEAANITNFQARYLGYEPGAPAASITGLLAGYDFVFVEERLEESLVAFMLLYSLSFGDVAFLPAKVATGTYRDAAHVAPELNEFVRSLNQADTELWVKANEKLDAAVARIVAACGAAAWQWALATFRAVQAALAADCADVDGWYAAHGFDTMHAYFSDNGLGPRCVEASVRRTLAAAAGELLLGFG